jgi:pimeloyl-ACP methyl ester carboxylesterase
VNLTGVGVVLLHGKIYGPGKFAHELIGDLHEEGAFVVTPEMPWRLKRMYNRSYDGALKLIEKAIQDAKANGAKKIVLAGHSMGANAVIAYAAKHPDIAAVIAMSPGHLPETKEMVKHCAKSIAKARKLIAEGKGAKRAIFFDRVQGWSLPIRTTPEIYLSYFDPEGPAVMPKNALKMPEIPFLWAVGKEDPIFKRGPEYVFTLAGRHPKSRYVKADAGHTDTPKAARKDIVGWLKSL